LSLARNLYYDLKPVLPVALRMAMRRWLVRHQLKKSGARWPIFPSAGIPPRSWAGWPDGKQFALVLTHDVEGRRGVANCEQLMELEMELAFRSSFNFVPEGDYKVSVSLRNEMQKEGFEVGVHDLHHNGKLYRSKGRFDRAAPRINRYLREWSATGFRSGFMHRNLDWLHALEIEYDMSTFDTDPFEPQPDGAHTIFPFWVPRPPDLKLPDGSNVAMRAGYAELPYTLPQDSTLFLLLREKDCRVWKRKLDWIAEKGGMALLNVHPDYISFRGRHASTAYPSELYREFLAYVREKYSDVVYCALPKTVATITARLGRSPCAADKGYVSSGCIA
jgi:hypothetical protein